MQHIRLNHSQNYHQNIIFGICYWMNNRHSQRTLLFIAPINHTIVLHYHKGYDMFDWFQPNYTHWEDFNKFFAKEHDSYDIEKILTRAENNNNYDYVIEALMEYVQYVIEDEKKPPFGIYQAFAAFPSKNLNDLIINPDYVNSLFQLMRVFEKHGLGIHISFTENILYSHVLDLSLLNAESITTLNTILLRHEDDMFYHVNKFGLSQLRRHAVSLRDSFQYNLTLKPYIPFLVELELCDIEETPERLTSLIIKTLNKASAKDIRNILEQENAFESLLLRRLNKIIDFHTLLSQKEAEECLQKNKEKVQKIVQENGITTDVLMDEIALLITKETTSTVTLNLLIQKLFKSLDVDYINSVLDSFNKEQCQIIHGYLTDDTWALIQFCIPKERYSDILLCTLMENTDKGIQL